MQEGLRLPWPCLFLMCTRVWGIHFPFSLLPGTSSQNGREDKYPTSHRQFMPATLRLTLNLSDLLPHVPICPTHPSPFGPLPLWSMERPYISPSTVNLQFTSCCSRNKGPTSSVSCKGLVPTYYKSHPHSVHMGRWLLPHIFIKVQFTLVGGISRAISLLCRW